MELKLIVAGGRKFDDEARMELELNRIIGELKNVTIISGYQRTRTATGWIGADYFGERYAKRHNIPLEIYPADWDQYGKKAGYIRNSHMANIATHLVAFWDGESKGTKMMIDLAVKKGLVVEIIRYNKP